MKYKRILCALLAAAQMLALAACGTESTPDSIAEESGMEESVADVITEATTTVTTTAQTTEVTTTAPAETTTVPEEPSDTSAKTPEDAVKLFQKALKDDDHDAMLRYSDMELLYRYRTLAKMAEEPADGYYDPETADAFKDERSTFEKKTKYTDAEWKKVLFDEMTNKKMGELKDIFESVDLKSGEKAPKQILTDLNDFTNEMNDNLAEMLEDITAESKEEWEEEYPDEYDVMIAYLDQIEKMVDMIPTYTELYIYSTDYVDEDENTTVSIGVYRTKESEWAIGFFMEEVVGSLTNIGFNTANAAARTVYNASNTALVDIETDDHDVSYLQGEYTFKGTDYVGVKKPKTFESEDDLKQEFRRVSARYFDGIAEIPEIRLYIENGACNAVAVVTKDGFIGCYPKKNTAESGITIDNALDYVRE